VLAQVEVTYSKSIIEAWWHSLKHQWLHLNALGTMAHLQALIAFFAQRGPSPRGSPARNA
jgi:hypothetical protein